jgi:ABC-2 type transport system permease protein
MFRLLEIEWLKLRGYRPFWVLMALFIVLLFLTNFVTSHGFFFKTHTGESVFTPNYGFPKVWDYVGFWVRLLGGLLPVFIIISTTNEIQYRTNRQNVIDGWSRAEFFHAKWLSCLVLAVAVTLVAAALGAGFGFFAHAQPTPPPGSVDPFTQALIQQTDAHPEATGHLDRLFYMFLLVLNYTGLAMTLSFFVKRGVVTIILFVIFCYALEKLTGGIINRVTHTHIGDYFPLECSAGLLGLPKPDVVKQLMGPQAEPTNTALALTSGAWLVFYYAIGWWKLRRSDW